MSKQDYHNHVRYYPPHHFIFYPIVSILLFISVRKAINEPGDKTIWIVISLLTVVITWLSFMTRQHYALTLQNRVVRLEMRLRYFQITNQRLEPLEARLNFKQLAALRFAADEELESLVQQTLTEGLSAADIKKNIKNWTPDMMRV